MTDQFSGTQICGPKGERAREVLDLVSDKWSMYVVASLGAGPLRFNEARRTITGISQRMLTVTFRKLEREGLFSRTVTPTVPPQVTYALTSSGESLRNATQPLFEWAIASSDAAEAARAAYDARHAPLES